MKTIIFFSWQHLWSMKNHAGAPSYHHTITYYMNSADWDVYLFTADETNMELDSVKSGRVFLYKSSPVVNAVMAKPKVNMLVRHKKHRDFTRWAVREASKIIKKKKAADCYLYAYEVWGVLAAGLLAGKYQLPLITRFQGTILSFEKHNLFHRLIRYPHFEALETKADLIVMTDDGSMGDDTLKSLHNDSPVLFLRNGLDLYETYEKVIAETDTSRIRKKLGFGENDRILLMASRLTGWKRVDRGILALSEVVKSEPGVRLVIAGDGDERRSLEELAAKLNVLSHVKFLGSVPQKKLYQYMLAADLFLSLYDFSNLGNPVFEAMLMGRTIIALNVGATQTVLRHGQNGILINEKEQHRIPQEIIKFLRDKKESERLAGNAYKYAVSHFYSWTERMGREEAAILNITKRKV